MTVGCGISHEHTIYERSVIVNMDIFLDERFPNGTTIYVRSFYA
jgi:hypothetical protein